MPKIPIEIQIELGLIKVHRNSPVTHKFWFRVNKQGPLHPVLNTQCWVWTGRITDGYGRFHISGEGDAQAHRTSYEILVGEIPNNLWVLHKCDNRSCVRPEHLFLGTAQDNTDDMVVKGRQNPARGEKSGARLHPEKLARGDRNGSRIHPEKMIKGEGHYRAKLTEADVLEIRLRYKGHQRIDGGAALGKEFGVDFRTISLIIRRITWKHI